MCYLREQDGFFFIYFEMRVVFDMFVCNLFVLDFLTFDVCILIVVMN